MLSTVHIDGVREGNRSGSGIALDFEHKDEMIPLWTHRLT
jgi:hypothetical protein